jgi:hypothetical protein
MEELAVGALRFFRLLILLLPLPLLLLTLLSSFTWPNWILDVANERGKLLEVACVLEIHVAYAGLERTQQVRECLGAEGAIPIFIRHGRKKMPLVSIHQRSRSRSSQSVESVKVGIVPCQKPLTKKALIHKKAFGILPK